MLVRPHSRRSEAIPLSPAQAGDRLRRTALYALPVVLPLIIAASAHAQQGSKLLAPWTDVTPPAEIAGLSDARPSAPLEFSHAWLRRTESVRLRRAELIATGALHGITPDSAAALGAALTGTLRMPVVPLHYSDVAEPFAADALTERLFGASHGDTLSFADYWDEVSGGLLQVTGAVAPWVRLPESAAHYLPADEHGWGRFGRIIELRVDALTRADSALDFGDFDNDGPDGIPNSGDDDGFADFVAFVYALPCPAGSRAGGIWPHRAAMPPFATKDTTPEGTPIQVSDYVILPAVDPVTCAPLQIGVLAHETGHALGLPDLYDYDGSTQGIGAWGLMGTGSHAAPHSPAHPGAWEKEQLGWVRVDWLRDSAPVRLTSVGVGRTVLRYDVPSGGYLLFENRQQQGSDAQLPGHGLLAWRIDPERGELGAWNSDERRSAVRVIAADRSTHLLDRLRASATDPFPGAAARLSFVARVPGGLALSDIEESDGVVTANVALGYAVPTLVLEPGLVRMTVRAGGTGVTHSVQVATEGGDALDWRPRTRARWLRAARDGDRLVLRALPGSLAPGLYGDTVYILRDDERVATLPVSMYVATSGVGQTVATELPWSWGLAVGAGRILQASYGWDALGLRPRPRLLSLQEGATHPSTLSRLPADALYAPVLHPDGSAHVLARTRDENLLFHVHADGSSELVAQGIGDEPAYGMTQLVDGDLLIAEWSGQLLRVRLSDGHVSEYARLPARLYQLTSDGTGTVFAATYGGDVLSLTPEGTVTVLSTGFGEGRLVAIAATPDGTVFAAERGGAGRIIRIEPGGTRRTVFRRDGAEFYGIAVANDDFVYALDLNARELLRFPIGD